MRFDRVAVGRVGKPHGLHGAFVVEDASEEPDRFEVESKRARGRPVIRLDRRVERGTALEVERATLGPTGENEYYVADLVGATVVEEGGRELGRIVTVEPYEANDVLELDTGMLLPMVEDCIREIDLERSRVVVSRGFAHPG